VSIAFIFAVGVIVAIIVAISLRYRCC